MQSYTIDLIIPVYRPDEKLASLLKRIHKQRVRLRRIYIMNTVTDISISQFTTDYEDIEVIPVLPQAFDHGATRDLGASMSDADILLFMTQDAVPYDDLLIERLLAPFEDEQVAAAYARQLPDKNCSTIEQYTRSFNYPEQSNVKSLKDLDKLGIKTFFCSNVCAAYRRTYYQEMGGFVHDAIFNEDMIMAGKLVKKGYKIAYQAEARVIHSHNYSFVQQFHRNFDVAVSQKTYPEVFEGIRSEGEGMRLVCNTAQHLLEIRQPFLIFSLFVQSAFKYAGYFLGKRYQKLPQWVVRKCTMNPRYWGCT